MGSFGGGEILWTWKGMLHDDSNYFTTNTQPQMNEWKNISFVMKIAYEINSIFKQKFHSHEIFV